MPEPTDPDPQAQPAQEESPAAETAPDAGAASKKVVRAADFNELVRTDVGAGPSLDDLLGVKFEVEAVLGRVVLPIEEILKLGSGSILELDRPVSEPVDLMVQGIRVARGEVVVLDDNFGIRINEIARPRTRT